MTLHAFGNDILEVVEQLLAVFDLPVVVALIDRDYEPSLCTSQEDSINIILRLSIIFLSRRIAVENQNADSGCIPGFSFKHILAVEFVFSQLVQADTAIVFA